MRKNVSMDYRSACRILADRVSYTGTERIPLESTSRRVLAEDIYALEDIPSFDRSPYDGYAFRTEDVRGASKDKPVTLSVIETIAAGCIPKKAIVPHTAARIMTGGMIPENADAVIKYELTHFTEEKVTIFSELKPGDNIVRAGDDAKKGTSLAEAGMKIDPGTAGMLAALGIAQPLVYRKPVVGIISTGNEVIDTEETENKGKIRNSSSYMLVNALLECGTEPVYLGHARDCVEEIVRLMKMGLKGNEKEPERMEKMENRSSNSYRCDAIIVTGGVSVGDYDLTPNAMELAGTEILVRRVSMKPGMACAMGFCSDIPVFGLSGNPAAAMTTYYAIVQPALKKLAGNRSYMPEELDIILDTPFQKSSPCDRMLRGNMRIKNGQIHMELNGGQGNAVVSSMVGSNLMAVIPAGTECVPAGSSIKGFFI